MTHEIDFTYKSTHLNLRSFITTGQRNRGLVLEVARGAVNIIHWDSMSIYISRCAVYYTGDEMVGRARPRACTGMWALLKVSGVVLPEIAEVNAYSHIFFLQN